MLTVVNEGREVGVFEIVSGEVYVSDPCYEQGTWCQGRLENVKNGKWDASVKVVDEGSWGQRIAQLTVEHQKHAPRGNWKTGDFEVGVDSGQAGVFDALHYRNDNVAKGVDRLLPDEKAICEDEPWYSLCCDRTLADEQAGVIPFGAVSSSGFGDGGYLCDYHVNGDGEIDAIRITFIDEDQEDY